MAFPKALSQRDASAAGIYHAGQSTLWDYALMLRTNRSLCCFSFTAMSCKGEFIYALWVLVPLAGTCAPCGYSHYRGRYTDVLSRIE
jgi:hypothetical protein